VKPAHDPFLASRRRAQAAEVFARAAATHESSARRLRLTGSHRAAARVEATAVLVRERIQQPAALDRLDAAVHALRRAEGLAALLDAAVAGAIDLVGADSGSLQLLDPDTRTLRMAAHHGFDPASVAQPAMRDEAAGFRAVQSTPLVDATGTLRGVLSTHFDRPHRPTAHELGLAATHARMVADEVARLDA
jgi:hypothetical protein